MGVHDYICFIQKNDQCLYFFDKNDLVDEEEIYNDDDNDKDRECGKSTAIIVKVPSNITYEEINKMKLKEFANFDKIVGHYSWDDWNFTNIPGDSYRNMLMDSEGSGIWKDSTHFDGYYVTFDPFAYDVFVLCKYDPKAVPYAYYKLILENRNIEETATDKNILFNIISNN
ncbi:Hypothetical protein ORPV_480 [Orpheovirus IHUMI-LCC2]|uniref:Uncharacterized protein n=1 Tax=Orpheovirus IHUMI-LCC2 TaxID=2023057 RepID=A0A2I2L4D4_9VIRU|nr:Hypothetical protein ORPV_480 [Orpheovirus IHUMI-LCC2]SNW62384.1 Hypothetical protein ORPV_480 [Orpheovirus IHUMI-LCC2]